MKPISLNTFSIPEAISLTLKDLRSEDHPEFQDTDNLRFHIEAARKQNGLRYYGRDIADEVFAHQLDHSPLNFIQHQIFLLRDAVGIIKYSTKHGKSSLSRYKNYTYEALDLLKNNKIKVKHEGKIYNGITGQQRVELVKSINELCSGIAEPSVLEAGCGSGINIYLLNQLNPQLKIHAFEYTNARAASAIVNLFHTDLINRLFLADVCNLKLPDNAYDVVYSNHVLEQLGQERATRALNEMWRVCKRGIVVSEPSIHGASLYEKWRMRKLGYCEDLLRVAQQLPGAEIIMHQEDNIHPYPNTSYHLIVKKKS